MHSTGESYGLTAQHIRKTLYRSILTLTNKVTTHQNLGQEVEQNPGANP